jgi:UPF0271 protein
MPSRTKDLLQSALVKLDFNCDLGEGEPVAKTRTLMRYITSANIACGGHAGNLRSMETCIRLGKRARVHVGAHPGVASNFGRGSITLTPEEFELLLLQQVGTFEKIARSERVALHHIKLHGSLYHAVDRSPNLARAYLQTVRRFWPRSIIFAKSGGLVHKLSRAARVTVWPEAFLDRAYADDGSLVPRDHPAALVTRPRSVLERLDLFKRTGTFSSLSGKSLPIAAKTVCLHSDTPNALRFLKIVLKAL